MQYYREQELASTEAAALKVESMERAAETRFDTVFDAAEQAGTTETVTATPEFRDWMAARAATDVAWGRWAEVMQAAEPGSAKR